jgi:hypothetical protein
MRRFALPVSIIMALGLGVAPSAFAADPDVQHFTITESFTDLDFCGTGQAVDVSVSIMVTVFLAPNQPVDSRSIAEGNEVYANPQNGATVISHTAGPLSSVIISGDPAGEHTQDVTVNGLTRLLRTAQGSVLVRNAGYLVLHQVIDGDGNVISNEIVVDRGPHPIAESGFVLFCEVVTDALGLS